MSSNNTYRETVVEHISLLASASAQLDYETRVPVANVHAELVCGFCDDLYHPTNPEFLAAFTEDELKDLAVLYGLLHFAAKIHVSSVTDLLKTSEWRDVIAFAKELQMRISK